MSVRRRLTIAQFGQFFVWGCWLVTLGAYALTTVGLSGPQVGVLYSMLGLSSLVTPGLVGLAADRWLSPERLYASLHAVAGLALLGASLAEDVIGLFVAMAVVALAYMPTISLGYAVSYALLEGADEDVVAVFPRIRVWGTVGFIVAMWTVSLSGWELSSAQLVLGGTVELCLAGYLLTLAHRPPAGIRREGTVWSALGLDAFRFFRSRQLAVFFAFAFALGVLLALSGNWVDVFLHDFGTQPTYADALAVRYPAMLISLSQVSEVVFILLIPFFLGRLGIRFVMLLAMTAWVVRFALLGFGDPGAGLWLLLGAMIAYGCAFDFFNIAGSLYVETQVAGESRASAQGLFMMMVNGFGAVAGSLIGGFLFDVFTTDDVTDWGGFWLTCMGCAAILMVLFVALFRAPGANDEPGGHSGEGPSGSAASKSDNLAK